MGRSRTLRLWGITVIAASVCCLCLGQAGGAVQETGRIVGWGTQVVGVDLDGDFAVITSGVYHSLALKEDGAIVAWGSNGYGQCDIPSPNADFIAVAAGGEFSLGLKEDGSIVAWGWNDYGQCDIPSPNTNFIAVSAGDTYSLALQRVCRYVVAGDLNDDCEVDFDDFALMAANWLIDCYIEPVGPACVVK